jgi:hypothetical protein
MQSLTNNEIIELLISLSEKFNCTNVSGIIDELDAGDEFMRNS